MSLTQSIIVILLAQTEDSPVFKANYKTVSRSFITKQKEYHLIKEALCMTLLFDVSVHCQNRPLTCLLCQTSSYGKTFDMKTKLNSYCDTVPHDTIKLYFSYPYESLKVW